MLTICKYENVQHCDLLARLSIGVHIMENSAEFFKCIGSLILHKFSPCFAPVARTPMINHWLVFVNNNSREMEFILIPD